MRTEPKANFVSKLAPLEVKRLISLSRYQKELLTGLAMLLVCLTGAIVEKSFSNEQSKYPNAVRLSADKGSNRTHSTGKAMIRLAKWSKGITVQSLADRQAFIYLRFYEWNLFDAVRPGEHTAGKDKWPWVVSSDGKKAVMKSEPMQMTAEARNDGVVLNLTVTNVSDHDWPETAAIIPCLSPDYARSGVPVNPRFYDEEHERTYFVGRNGLELLKDREIHFRNSLRDAIIHRSSDKKGTFKTFSEKWPTSDRDAVSGLMVRESVDGKWVVGIAWADFLSAQGHNPRKCAHLSVRVGPLKCGQSKTVRGKIYLFQGTKEDCLRHFRRDFRAPLEVPSDNGTETSGALPR
ncbi:MAG: hypothetical protein V3V47_04815 [Desulfobacteria bacterium]